MKKSKFAFVLLALGLTGSVLASCNGDKSSSPTSGLVETETFVARFVNGDEVLQSSQVEKGKYATYTGETPVKASTAAEDFTFKGWDLDPATTPIVQDTTFTAQFTSTTHEYVVRFMNGDEVLQTSNVKHGENATYTGTTPTKESTEQEYYKFVGWNLNPEETAITKNTDFQAQFKALSRFEVVHNFEDMNAGDKFGDWTVVKEENNNYIEATGSTWTEGVLTDFLYNDELDTLSENFEMSARIFIEGNPEGNLTFVSNSFYEHSDETFNKMLFWHTTGGNGYVQSFKNSTNWVDGNCVMDCGWFTMHGVGTDDNIGSIVHNQWVTFKLVNLGGQVSIYVNEHLMGRQNLEVIELKDLKFGIFMGNPDAKVRFDDFIIKSVKSYNVTFKNGDNTLYSYKVQDGETPEYIGAAPTKDPVGSIGYVWSGWDYDLNTPIHEDKTINATFDEETRTVKATFKVGEEVITTKDVTYGSAPSFDGTTPTKADTDGKHYKFLGWTPAISEIIEDTVYTAKFFEYSDNQIIQNYDIYDVNETVDGFVVKEENGNKYLAASGSGWVEPKIIKLFNNEIALTGNWEFSLDIYLVGQYAGNIAFLSDSIYNHDEGNTNRFVQLHPNPGNAYMQSYSNSSYSTDGTMVSDFGWLTMHGVADDATVSSILHDHWNTIKVTKDNAGISVYFNDCLMGTITAETNQLTDLNFGIFMGDPSAEVRVDNFKLTKN